MKIDKRLWLSVSMVLAMLTFFPSCDRADELSSDKKMRDYFFAHQTDFQALADMALQDKDADGIIKLESPSADKYRVLMTRVGAHYVFNGKSGGIAVTTETWGNASKGVVLGYRWMPNPPAGAETVKNIDGLMNADLPVGHELKYSLLAGHWYIVFQH